MSSGVEKDSIEKDFEMIKEFVKQVRRADEAFIGKNNSSPNFLDQAGREVNVIKSMPENLPVTFRWETKASRI